MESIPIFNSFLAKQLVRLGNNITDLQKNKKVENATVFYFEKTEKILKDIDELTAK